jgi:hypothetical protein
LEVLMKANYFLAALSLLIAFLMAGCAPPPADTVGTLTGNVYSGNPATALPGVSVMVFDAGTNAPVAPTVQTDANGKYSFSLNEGSYYVNLYKQGYNPIPSSTTLLLPVPLTITGGATTTNNVRMTPSALTGTGWITGTVASGIAGVNGVLVAAEATGVAYSSYTDSNGNYAIYNVPASATAYALKAYIQGYSSTSPAAIVTANTATTANLTLTAITTGNVTATFSLNSPAGVTPPANIVTSLLHPVTKQPIPGLSLTKPYAATINYTFSGVADGTYIVRTSLANDTIAVYPDAIVNSGDFTVTVTGGVPTPANVTIPTTAAVTLLSPTNLLSSTVPVLVAGPTPVFTWSAYPNTDDYVVEVEDANTGTVVWGGFKIVAGVLTKQFTTTTTTATYNSDGTGTALVAGNTYRWRVYASQNTGTGWQLISMSEVEMGLITIQ